MTFQIPAAEDYKDRFEFSLDGKKVHKILHLKNAPIGAVEAFEADKNITGMLMCCEDEDTRTVIRNLKDNQFTAISREWQKASGVQMGESGASSDS